MRAVRYAAMGLTPRLFAISGRGLGEMLHSPSRISRRLQEHAPATLQRTQ